MTDSATNDIEHIYVVVGESGDPLCAYESREEAESLVAYWRDGPMNVTASIEPVEFERVNNE